MGLQDVELRIAHDNLASRRVAELNGYLLVDRDDGVDIYRYFGEKNTSLDDTREGRSKWDKEKVLVILVLRFFCKIFCFLVFLGGGIKVFKVLA